MIKAKFKEYYGLTNQAVKELADNKLQVEQPSALELEIKNEDHVTVPDCFNDTPKVLKTEAQYLYELSDTQIIGPRPIVKINGQYFSATAMDNYLENRDFPTKYAFRDMFLESPDRHIESAFLMYGRRIDAYFQWFHKNLKKLHWYEDYRNRTGTAPKILVPESLPQWGKDSLHLIGVDSDDYYEVGREIITVDQLIVPSHPRRKNKTTPRFPRQFPETTRWMRNEMLKNVSYDEAKKRRVYISRRDANRRRIENEEEVLDYLKQYNFESHRLADLPFEKQVKIFAEADVILGPHGAGFANIIWSTNATVFEISNDWANETYMVLANELGHDYYVVPTNRTVEASHPNPHHQDIIVNVNKLDDVINSRLEQST